MILSRLSSWILGIGCFTSAVAQKETIKGWHLLDKVHDGYNGISLDKAYNFIKNKPAKTIIVAVLDGGVDTLHQDLKQVLWRNTKEKAGNNKDDDGNGYNDDEYGWNFLGNPDGTNVEKESAEAARLYQQLKHWYDFNMCDSICLKAEYPQKYKLWNQVNTMVRFSAEEKFTLKIVQATTKTAHVYDSIITAAWGKSEFSADELENFIPQNQLTKKAKFNYLRFLDLLQLDKDISNKEIFSQLHSFIDRQEGLEKAKDTTIINYRTLVTGDDENDWHNRKYGNNDVMGRSCKHGTHVTGIIAASQTNDQGVKGIADKVQIMTVRVVPDGDEYDKDVALGIHYAVDNGAKVINMSFGKEVSPHKQWVDEAIRYAAQKDVLIIHAAGNESENLDEAEVYPSASFNDKTVAPNIITVGASGDSSLACGMVADFTNYGSKVVDVMAPGVKIYSTVPSGAGYAFMQGTSMAAPVVSGIAALIRSRYPGLNAAEVKLAIENSADTTYKHMQVVVPGDKSKKRAILFGQLCKTGGIVNAYAALKLAQEMADAKNGRVVVK